jgi:hypothetical protein
LAVKVRRQRVTLRFKRRQDLKNKLRVGFVRSLSLALLVGFGAGLVTGRNSFRSQFIQRHTPQVEVIAPGALGGLPVLSDLPAQRFWLWWPGSEAWLQKRLIRKYLSVRAVHVEKNFQMNRVVIRMEPRVPLVVWNEAGLDRDGVAFVLTPGTWKTLPRVELSSMTSPRQLSGWLSQLAAQPKLWGQITSVGQDSLSNMELVLKTGAHVIWGPLEASSNSQKAQALLRAFDDAHAHLGGAARADLRFFDQGRIIILPKGSERRNLWRNQTS